LQAQLSTLVTRARRTAPEYGRAPLLADLTALRDAARLRTTRCPIRGASLLGPKDQHGWRELVISPDVEGLATRRFVELYEVGRAFAHYRPSWDDACAAFAFVGVLNARDVHLGGRGPEWVRTLLREVASLADERWPPLMIPVFADAAYGFLAGDIDPASLRVRSVLAQEALQRAREARLAGTLPYRAVIRLYAHAFRVAEAVMDHETACSALIGVGHVWRDKGYVSQARAAYRRAGRHAKTHGQRWWEGAAAHELFGLAVDGDEHIDADQLAGLAFELYRGDRLGMLRLAHDVACYWIKGGLYGVAYDVIQILDRHWPDEDLEARMLVAAEMARAAAGVGDLAGFHGARLAMEERAGRVTAAASLARSLVAVGYGALWLGDLEMASNLAGRALDTSRRAHSAVGAAEAVALYRDIDCRVGRGECVLPPSPARDRLAGRITEDLPLVLAAA
jgi:hypothetical protein